LNTKLNSCPCGTGRAFEKCCQPYIKGSQEAPTAEALMRSRYSAYVINDEQYLLDSWHASTRPKSIVADPLIQWLRLKIVDANSQSDHVEFVATYRLNGKAHKLCENSRFIYEAGKWFYLQAAMDDTGSG
jgi:SEC-C motif-containing protein